MRITFLIFTLIIGSAMINVVHAQEMRDFETISIPYTAANTVYSAPDYFQLSSKHVANWIVNIENNLIYNPDNPESKIVLRLKENPTDEKFLEVAMFSPGSYKLWIAVNNEELGYMRAYENNNSWYTDATVTVSLVQNERLNVNNGERTILDRLRIGPLALGVIEVYGMDGTDADLSAFGGDVVIDIMSGNPLDNPIMMVPFIVTGLAGVTVATLLIIKKR